MMKDERNWYISRQEHGVFLMCGNYCVARLDDREEKSLCRDIQRSIDGEIPNNMLTHHGKLRGVLSTTATAVKAVKEAKHNSRKD